MFRMHLGSLSGVRSGSIVFAVGAAMLALALIAALALAPRPQAAPDFTLPALGGGSVSLQAYRGRLVVLNFWATWCAPCQEEMPDLQAIDEKNRARGVTVVGIDVNEGPGPVADFVGRVKVAYPIALDGDGSVAARYGVSGLPVTLLISPGGLIVTRHNGQIVRSQVEQEIVQALPVAP